MKRSARLWLTGIAACFLAISSSAENTLQLDATISLPGVQGRFDHLTVDAARQRLFAAALGNNTVEVLDLAANHRVTSIRNLRKPTAALSLASRKEIGVGAGDDGAFKTFQSDTFEPAATVTALDDADNVRFDPAGDRIYVGYGDGALAIIDAKTLTKIGDIKLPAHPESFQLEHNGSRVFVNLPDARQIAVVDREKKAVIKTWPMTKFQSNFPMALDEPSHRLFVGCRRPARLVIFDTLAEKEMTDIEIAGDTDDLFYDAKRRRLYISCGEGFVDVISAIPNQPLRRSERIPTRSGARTSYFSSDLDRFYLAVPNRGREPAEMRIYQPIGQ